MRHETLSAMRQSVVDGLPDTARNLAKQAISQGIPVLAAISEGFVPGIETVGEQFAKRQVFLPDLMASAEAMRAAMAVLDMELRKEGINRPAAGVVVLGTTKGDIHEIGKQLVGTLLVANGFRVHDLGADVPGPAFVAKALEFRADIVGVSALLTTTMRNQKTVIEELEKASLRPQVKVMVGGAPVTRRWAEEIGADGYAKDAMAAVALARSLMDSSSQPNSSTVLL